MFRSICGNWKRWTAIIFLIGLCNFCSGIFYLIAAGLPTGKLTIKNINIMMGAMFMVIVVAVIIQKLREKRNALDKTLDELFWEGI